MKFLRKRHFLLNNEKGLSLLSMIIAAGIGAIVIVTVTKYVSNMSGEQKKLERKIHFTQIRQGIYKILRDQKAWDATVEKAIINDSPGCFPGKTAGCKLDFWHNDLFPPPTTFNDYVNGAYRWMCNGVALFRPDGVPIKLIASDCTAPDPELAVRARLPGLKNYYVRVDLGLPVPLPEGKGTIPNFSIRMADRAGFQHLYSFMLMQSHRITYTTSVFTTTTATTTIPTTATTTATTTGGTTTIATTTTGTSSGGTTSASTTTGWTTTTWAPPTTTEFSTVTTEPFPGGVWRPITSGVCQGPGTWGSLPLCVSFGLTCPQLGVQNNCHRAIGCVNGGPGRFTIECEPE